MPITIAAGLGGSAQTIKEVPRRIPFRDIVTYAGACGIAAGDFDRFRYLVEAMDRAALQARSEKQTAEAAQQEPGSADPE